MTYTIRLLLIGMFVGATFAYALENVVSGFTPGRSATCLLCGVTSVCISLSNLGV